jgi:cobalt-zinc-cadmium efflux system protein
MEFTPKGLDLDEVRKHILRLDHVKDVHDLHASTVATGLPTITAHVVVDDECFTDGHAAEVLSDLKGCVAEHFPVSVTHSTFQIETEHISEHETNSGKHA